MKNDFPRIYISPEIRRRMIEIARVFRKTSTKSEKILWQALRGKKWDGIKFRRWRRNGYFVVDSYNSVNRLIAEVDGPVHASQREADQARQEILQELGRSVLGIESQSIEMKLPTALDLIRQAIRGQTQRREIPSPTWGEGKGGG